MAYSHWIEPEASTVFPHATHVLGVDLNKNGLALQNHEGILQTVDLGLTAGLLLLVGFRLCDALSGDGLPRSVDGIQFVLDTLEIGAELRDGLVQGCCLLVLVLTSDSLVNLVMP